MSKKKKNQLRKSSTLSRGRSTNDSKRNDSTDASHVTVKRASKRTSMKDGSAKNEDSFNLTLLDRASTQWQFGDWDSLTRIEPETLKVTPNRDKIALLIAAAHFQIGNISKGIELTELSKTWGVDESLIARFLIAGVYNNLGNIAAIGKQDYRASQYFRDSLTTGMPDVDINLLESARLSQQHNLLANKKDAAHNLFLHLSPRIVLVSGMMRSGSTATLNIVVDLLKANRKQFIKYYIGDLKNIATFRDHVLQNPDVTFILKTHELDPALVELFSEFPARIVHTKRNIYEVAASYIRMTKNRSSPFFRQKELTLNGLLKDLKAQLVNTKNVESLDSALVIDALELSGDDITAAVSKIDELLALESGAFLIDQVAKKHIRKNSAIRSRKLGRSSFTSLGHDKDTFYHKDHVLESGTEVNKYLQPEWKKAITRNLAPFLDMR